MLKDRELKELVIEMENAIANANEEKKRIGDEQARRIEEARRRGVEEKGSMLNNLLDDCIKTRGNLMELKHNEIVQQYTEFYQQEQVHRFAYGDCSRYIKECVKWVKKQGNPLIEYDIQEYFKVTDEKDALSWTKNRVRQLFNQVPDNIRRGMETDVTMTIQEGMAKADLAYDTVKADVKKENNKYLTHVGNVQKPGLASRWKWAMFPSIKRDQSEGSSSM